MPWYCEIAEEIPWGKLEQLMYRTIDETKKRICKKPRRVLLLPPDKTRAHCGAGKMTEIFYNILKHEADVHVIPTLGQHIPHIIEDNKKMFGSIPQEKIHVHDAKHGCVYLGEVSAVSQNKDLADMIPISLNTMLMKDKWDLIISIGHVVPHEVFGFANHNKNYFIGLGGTDTIAASHIFSAFCGIEQQLGQMENSIRACFNRAETKFLAHLPNVYVLTVMKKNEKGEHIHTGLFIGNDFDTYLQAANLSQKQNVHTFNEPVKKIVCYVPNAESTWLANKAIYRTRMAIKDGGELIIIAPELKRFGEQKDIDLLIRKYGYAGSVKLRELYKEKSELHALAHGIAHLIHGSGDGKFSITYATDRLSKQELNQVNYNHISLSKAMSLYKPEGQKEGWREFNNDDTFYFIPNPATGLWTSA